MKEYQLEDGSLISFQQLTELHPDKSFPRDAQGRSYIDAETALSLGAIEVVATAKPECAPTQYVMRDGVEIVGGALVERWAVIEHSDEVKASILSTAAAQRREEAKRARAAAVATITVIVGDKQFDGDEISQGRMARAIIGLQAAGAPTIKWTLADNSEAVVTTQELIEALVLAGSQQSELWSIE